ncbi:MAG: TlpA family protein disulfide reductase [Phycisphaerales bacterium]|nr:TlpA family protein disulfide reductase [Phycisphaerales bacterium]
MIRSLLTFAVVAVCLATITLVSGDAGAQDRQGRGLLKTGSQAPAWTLKDADGKEHSLSGFAGKVVVMDFWATWCVPCVKAMPGLQKLHNAYADKGVAVIGVNTAESGDPVRFMKENKFTYQLLLNGDEVASEYKVRGIPAFYVIDGAGKIVYSAVGYDPKHEKEIEKVINEELARNKKG